MAFSGNSNFPLIQSLNVKPYLFGSATQESNSYIMYEDDGITNSYTREGAMILNLLNQQFVDLIRSQGYNNKYRLLLITPIWGDSSTQNLKYFKIPLWDYSRNKFNYRGLICFKYSSFGIKDNLFISCFIKSKLGVEKSILFVNCEM